MPAGNLRVLHVASTFAVGIYAAVRQYIENTPDVEHHLLVEPQDMESFPSVASVDFFSQQRWRHPADVRRAVQNTDPSVVHVHSSWGGLFARIAFLRPPLIYQPHALASQGYGSSRLMRSLYLTAERALSLRTDAFVALSENEFSVLRRINGRTPIHQLLNVATIDGIDTGVWKPPGSPCFVMMGRIVLQKDPELFAEFARLVRMARPDAACVWIGDGDPDARRLLESVGVRVTGWLGPEDVARELSKATVYLHTSKYEGFPLSVLDAARVGVPILVRNVPSMAEIPVGKFDSARDAVAQCLALAEDEGELFALRKSSVVLDQMHAPALQNEQLMRIYASAARLGTAGGP
jgi:glycosyltransferase involved in cell wall biosynthesis